MENELKGYQKKNYEELELKDDFMFGKVMQDRELCRRTLETLLEMPIKEVTRLEKQKAIELIGDRKKVRLDIYVQDSDKTVYDAEMQRRHKMADKENLPRRSRYYLGMIDLDILGSGVDYQNLPDSYVIFICTFDPFGKKRSRYTFENTCREIPELRLDDGATKVFFNTKGDKKDVSLETEMLLDYLESKSVTSELTQRLDEAVEEARMNEKWRLEYMKERLFYMEAREDGYEDGFEEGHKAGQKAGHEEGLKEGHREGLKEGFKEGIEGTVTILEKLKIPSETIQREIQNQYHLPPEEAEKYLSKSSNKN